MINKDGKIKLKMTEYLFSTGGLRTFEIDKFSDVKCFAPEILS